MKSAFRDNQVMSTPANSPPCVWLKDNEPFDVRGMWFTIQGMGNTFIAWTCGGNATTFDANTQVFSGTCQELVCEAANQNDETFEMGATTA